jgi:hypothetical protein
MTNHVSVKPQTNKLLLDEAPLVVLPSLAKAIGLESAVVLQQIHYLLRQKLERLKESPKENERDIHDGRVWVWNSYEKWKENYFCFSSVRSLQRIFLKLEKKGLIIAGNYNESTLNKTKWYSINYDHPIIKATATEETTKSHKKNNSLFENNCQRKTVVDNANLAQSSCQNGAKEDASLAPYITKTSSTKNYETKTSTTKEESSLTDTSKKERDETSTVNYFPVPANAAEAGEIIKNVLKIIYPNGEGIKNKSKLIHAMKKKLMNGRLEIPEGWNGFQKKKKETADHDQESQKIADHVTFQKAKEEFARLPYADQKKYLDAARKTAGHAASEVSDSTALFVAIQLAAKEKKKEG